MIISLMIWSNVHYINCRFVILLWPSPSVKFGSTVFVYVRQVQVLGRDRNVWTLSISSRHVIHSNWTPTEFHSPSLWTFPHHHRFWIAGRRGPSSFSTSPSSSVPQKTLRADREEVRRLLNCLMFGSIIFSFLSWSRFRLRVLVM